MCMQLRDDDRCSHDAGGLPGYPISTAADRTGLSGQVGGQAGAGAFNTAGRRLLMAEEGHVLGDAMIPGDGQCANGRIGAYCTECPEGQNTTAEGCE